MSVKLVFKFLFVCFAFGLPLQALTEDKENSSSDEGRELSSFEKFIQDPEAFTAQLNLPPEPVLPPITPEQRKKFPPPQRKNELPKPVEQHIQAIEDLCEINSLEEQVKKVKKTLDGLKEAIEFYLSHYNRKIINKLQLDIIHSHLFWININVQWRYLDAGFRRNYDEYFLFNRAVIYNSENAGPKSFKKPWLHKVYRGLYCLSHGRPPPVETI